MEFCRNALWCTACRDLSPFAKAKLWWNGVSGINMTRVKLEVTWKPSPKTSAIWPTKWVAQKSWQDCRKKRHISQILEFNDGFTLANMTMKSGWHRFKHLRQVSPSPKACRRGEKIYFKKIARYLSQALSRVSRHLMSKRVSMRKRPRHGFATWFLYHNFQPKERQS